MTYRIVVGMDGSPNGDAALKWALDEADARGGEIIAVFCWQVPFLSFPGAFDREELEKAGENFIAQKVREVEPAPKVPLFTLVAEGDPAESLTIVSRDADLLVVGTRGRSPFTGLVLGSVSQRCAAAAQCPVLLVKWHGEHGGGDGERGAASPRRQASGSQLDAAPVSPEHG